MNLYQKIIEVRKEIVNFEKSKKADTFSYVDGDQVLGKILRKMNELGLILQPSTEVGEWKQYDYKNKKGDAKTDFIVWGNGSYTWINAENPEEREIVSFAYYGQQSNDLAQAYGSALTYRERYFLLKYFGIPTDGDDPDKKRREQEIKELSYDMNEKFKAELKKANIDVDEFYSCFNVKENLVDTLSYKAVLVERFEFLKELGIKDIRKFLDFSNIKLVSVKATKSILKDRVTAYINIKNFK